MARSLTALLSLLVACSSSSTPLPAPSARVASAPHLDQPRPVTAADEPVSAPEPSGIVYEIYVRSYQDSDGDGVGDLDGVRQRLDHLASLGVETVWLMPLFPAFGPAGYDVTDFDTITPEYGTADDLAELVQEAHALGMRVIIDLPINHVHRTHPWFQAAESGMSRPERDWFNYGSADPGDGRWFPSETRGYYYGYFGAELPDLNWDNAEVYDQIVAVMDRWLEAGADGYRLDAVCMLVEEDGVLEGTDGSHALISDLLATARANHPDTWFLAEASEQTALATTSWLGSRDVPEADAVLDFPRRDALLEVVETGDVAPLIDLINTEVKLGGGAAMGTFLGSHDVDRLPDVVTDFRARRALRVAQMLLPGTPVLYYGEEIDLANSTVATGQDYAWRGPMQWSQANNAGFTPSIPWFSVDPSYQEGHSVLLEQANRDSTLNLIRDLSCVRAQHGLDGDNTWRPVQATGGSTLAFVRSTEEGELLVVINLSDRPVADLEIQTSGNFTDLATDETVLGAGTLDLGVMAPWGYRVLSGGSQGVCRLAGQASSGSGNAEI